MRSFVRRRLLVVGLIAATGAVAIAVRAQDVGPAPPLPPLSAVIGAGVWRAEAASAPVALGVRYRQWLLSDAGGHQALLYLGVTQRVPTMLQWSGELGYQGDGYLVVAQRDATLRLVDGRSAPVAQATVQRLGDRRLLRSAVVGPRGIGRRGGDMAIGAAWDLARGHADTYYLVRVAVPDGDGAAARADEALATVLSRLEPA